MKENEKTNDSEYESPLEIAQMYFETGHGPTEYDSECFATRKEYEEYLQYIEMGPAGFYEAFKDDLDFDDMFVQEYGDSDEDDDMVLNGVITVNKERMEWLLARCVEHIIEMVGDSDDAYDTLTNGVGFTETELDTLVNGTTDPTDDDMVFCEDVTGVLGQMFAGDMSDLPEEAVRHLQEAYQICAENLK